MSYEKVMQAKRITIGTKQTVKALKEANVKELIIAEDADHWIKEKLVQSAESAGVTVLYVDSMKKLGKACNISVGAAAVAILL